MKKISLHLGAGILFVFCGKTIALPNKFGESKTTLNKYENYLNTLEKSKLNEKSYSYLQGLNLNQLEKEYQILMLRIENLLLEICTLQEDRFCSSSILGKEYYVVMSSLVKKATWISEGIHRTCPLKLSLYQRYYLNPKKLGEDEGHSLFYSPRYLINNDAVEAIEIQYAKNILSTLEKKSKKNRTCFNIMKDNILEFMAKIITLDALTTYPETIKFCAKWWKVKGKTVDFDKIHWNQNFSHWLETCRRCWNIKNNSQILEKYDRLDH